jgi:intein-encoded DNA endonuclease-like protein
MERIKKSSSRIRSTEKEEESEDTKWNIMCQALVDYKAKHGHTRVPQNYTVQGKRLGQWVSNFRSRTESDLPEESRRQLQEIGFTWRVRSSWDEMYKHMLNYKEKHGNCRGPKTYNNENGTRLGAWVLNQRTEYSRRAKGLKHHSHYSGAD